MSQLCSQCQNIFTGRRVPRDRHGSKTWVREQVECSNDSPTFEHHSPDGLYDSARQGCFLCSLILGSMEPKTNVEEFGHSTHCFTKGWIDIYGSPDEMHYGFHAPVRDGNDQYCSTNLKLLPDCMSTQLRGIKVKNSVPS
ncbi:hypothetical protein M426DRAFT_239356 [Hypoxylon sp. CI-4A]|nr:hypothetical protein M426DRAFT_239356 [Hypoxylon sp. CI-4A]